MDEWIDSKDKWQAKKDRSKDKLIMNKWMNDWYMYGWIVIIND